MSSPADRLAEARDLWTGYECQGGTWYAMYCNVDMDQTERANRPEVVWVRNSAAVVTAPPVDIEALVDAVGAALGVDTGACHENQFRAACDAARAVLREAGVLE